MARTRDLDLREYHISKGLYRELLWYCMQYPEKKERIRSCYDIQRSRLPETPRGGCVSDATFRAVETAIRLKRDVELIEKTAKKIWPYQDKLFLKTLTREDMSYWKARAEGLSMNEKEYHKRRKGFYVELARQMGKIG